MNKKIILIIAFFMLLILSASGLYLYNTLNSNYVFKIGDIKISPNEYKVYLYEQKKFFEETGGTDIWETDMDGVAAEDVAKQQTINSIVAVKSALTQAEKLNISLSEDELKTVKAESDRFYNEIGSERAEKFEITADDVYNIIKEGQIQKKVFNYITNGFEISNAEFKTYFDEYYKNNKNDLTNIKLKYIFKSLNKDKSNIEEVKSEMEKINELLKKGYDFNELSVQYSESSEKNEITMKKGLFGNKAEAEIYSAKSTGLIQKVIETDNGFYIFYITNIEQPDIKELEETVKSDYIQKKKQEIYQQQSDKWLTEVTIEKNDELFSSIKISDI